MKMNSELKFNAGFFKRNFLKRMFLVVFSFIVSFSVGRVGEAAIPSYERESLIALYNSTNGDGWLNNTGWLGAEGTECTWLYCDAMNIELENRVNRLLLVGNQLNGSIPSELGNLANLQALNLSENQLSGSIPLSLSNLTNLGELDLSYNQLEGEILTTLTKLDLWGGLDIRWNALYTNDITLKAFLNTNHIKVTGTWESTQTIAPADLTAERGYL